MPVCRWLIYVLKNSCVGLSEFSLYAYHLIFYPLIFIPHCLIKGFCFLWGCLNPQTHRYWDWLPDVKWKIYRSGDFGKCRHFTWFSFSPPLLLWYGQLLPSPLTLDEGRGEAPELAWAEWPLGGEGGLASWGPWPEPLFWEPFTEPPRHDWTPFCVSLWSPLVPSSRLIAVYFQLLTFLKTITSLKTNCLVHRWLPKT